MGTSGAYGGSPGFKPVRDETENWLDSGGGTGGPAPSGPPQPIPIEPTPPPLVPAPTPPLQISPGVASVIAALGRVLASSSRGGGGGGGGAAGGAAGGSRSKGRATAVGGRALGGAYGARAGVAAAVGELGLDLAELAGLQRFEQAERILEAAIRPSGDVFESELRQVCAEVVLWALTQEVEPTPVELTNRWVVEYVWQVWITEEGPTLQRHDATGYSRERAEDEMRAALEATVSAQGLPTDRPLTGADFGVAINHALSSLRRIAGTAA